MTAIWRNDGTGWKLLDPGGFPDEATLHTLVEQAPQLLPLAGAPALVVVGREVQLGAGFADLIAMEPTGRLAIVEIKLARNSESRRAVIAQVLTYAAYLDGLDPEVLERDILGKHLRERGHQSLLAAMEANDQTGSFDGASFTSELRESLRDGRFRLVIVLDAAPDELTRLVGYLGKVADKLVIDLVTVSSYDVAGSEILVPQRVEPERLADESNVPSAGRLTVRPSAEDVTDFIAAAEAGPESERQNLLRLADWAKSLEREGLVRLQGYSAARGHTLLPKLRADDAGLVTIASEGGGQLWLWRSVFVRRAPNALARLEAAIAPLQVKQGSTLKVAPDAVLDIVTEAYREAVGKLDGVK